MAQEPIKGDTKKDSWGRVFRHVRCGAKSKRSGKPCKKWAREGANRCRLHGGNHKKGGAAPQAKTSLKHGLFAKTLTPEEREKFAELFPEMLDNPELALLADAMFLRLKASTVAARADAAGMYVSNQTGTRSTTTKPMMGLDGLPVMYETGDIRDDGLPVRAPVIETITVEQVRSERQDVIGPVSELLMRAGRLTEAAVGVKKRTAGGAEQGSKIDKEDALAIMRDVFRDGGAYEPPEASDGRVPPPGAARRS